MEQVNYFFGHSAAVKFAAKCRLWRRAALISYGLFMASAVLNLIQFLGR